MDTLEEYQNFPPDVFRLTVPKTLVNESCTVSLISENENFFPGKVMSRFFVGNFLSRVPKNFLKETFCDLFQISPGTEKIWIRGGSMKIFR